MNLISKQTLIERGWRTMQTPDGYVLVAPGGRTVSIRAQAYEDYAWYDYPNMPADGFIEDYERVGEPDIRAVDLHDKDALHAIKRTRYGTFQLLLTPADIEALKAGKCIVWGQDEYTSIIYFHDEQAEG